MPTKSSPKVVDRVSDWITDTIAGASRKQVIITVIIVIASVFIIGNLSGCTKDQRGSFINSLPGFGNPPPQSPGNS